MTADTKQPLFPNRTSLAGRTVEITDEDESIVIAFVPVDLKPTRKP